MNAQPADRGEPGRTATRAGQPDAADQRPDQAGAEPSTSAPSGTPPPAGDQTIPSRPAPQPPRPAEHGPPPPSSATAPPHSPVADPVVTHPYPQRPAEPATPPPARQPATPAPHPPHPTATRAPGAPRANVTGGNRRKAQLTLTRLEPWSVMKFSFIISLVGFVILFVAVAVLYAILASLGVFDAVISTIRELTTSGEGKSGLNPAAWFSATRILGYTGLVGALNVILFTALATVGSVIYNLTADLVGGIQVTLSEHD